MSDKCEESLTSGNLCLHEEFRLTDFMSATDSEQSNCELSAYREVRNGEIRRKS